MSHLAKLLTKTAAEKLSPVTVRLSTEQINTIDKFASKLGLHRQELLYAMVMDGIEALKGGAR